MTPPLSHACPGLSPPGEPPLYPPRIGVRRPRKYLLQKAILTPKASARMVFASKVARLLFRGSARGARAASEEGFRTLEGGDAGSAASFSWATPFSTLSTLLSPKNYRGLSESVRWGEKGEGFDEDLGFEIASIMKRSQVSESMES
ncbi:hypothetical protein KFL_008780030 [Klebsormidium nitens]|uniref:Uncharacterized protein n=1 Tax=Klebsormidium nitens TaxID=105231 RepID=A0A1Y1IM05_KLENI|nr:hypothetical protein KFL_008780030 [Klebsormidium nitens]|eukprot:GAQ91900.1 hypothetical protein KFL_008780030 [Klebsormidium nitens]